jgi:hypothetical protein
VQLVEAALASWKERRWIDVPRWRSDDDARTLMSLTLNLPQPDGRLARHTLSAREAWRAPAEPAFNRIAYSAAHVVADALAPSIRGCSARSTGTHHRLPPAPVVPWAWGVAEAMDTAQRGMGLDWPTSLELIARSLDAARDLPGARSRAVAAPINWRPTRPAHRRRAARLRGTDGRDREAGRPPDRDGQPRAGLVWRRALDYEQVYGRVLSQAASRSSCTGWATCSTRRCAATGAALTSTARWDTALAP